MLKFYLVSSAVFFAVCSSMPFELFGTGVPQTGSVWPPFPHAGEDLWALKVRKFSVLQFLRLVN